MSEAQLLVHSHRALDFPLRNRVQRLACSPNKLCSGYRLGAVPDCVEGSPKRGDYALTTVLPTSRIPFSSSLKSYLSFRSKPLDEPPNPALSRYYLTLYPKREEQHRVLQECADLAPE